MSTSIEMATIRNDIESVTTNGDAKTKASGNAERPRRSHRCVIIVSLLIVFLIVIGGGVILFYEHLVDETEPLGSAQPEGPFPIFPEPYPTVEDDGIIFIDNDEVTDHVKPHGEDEDDDSLYDNGSGSGSGNDMNFH